MLTQVYTRSIHSPHSYFIPRVISTCVTPPLGLEQMRHSSTKNKDNNEKEEEIEEEIDLITLQKKSVKTKKKEKQSTFAENGKVLEQHKPDYEPNIDSQVPFEDSLIDNLLQKKKHGVKTMSRSSGVKFNHLKNLILQNMSGGSNIKDKLAKNTNLSHLDTSHSDSIADSAIKSLLKSEHLNSNIGIHKTTKPLKKKVKFDEPLGYPYFSKVFKIQQDLLKEFLFGKDLETQEISKLLELFKKIMKFNKQVKNKDNMLLYLTTLHRNEQYLNYFIWLNFGIDKRPIITENFKNVKEDIESKQEAESESERKPETQVDKNLSKSELDQKAMLNKVSSETKFNRPLLSQLNKILEKKPLRGEIESSAQKDSIKNQPVSKEDISTLPDSHTQENIINTIGELRSNVISKPAGSRMNGSFKDLLTSINKVSKNLNSNNGLPKMTKLSPMPIFEQHNYSNNWEDNSAAFEVNAESMESFLNEAKKKDDLNQDMLFKARLNYEWSKQQISGNPKTLEDGNFFTPVLIPKTVVPINSLVNPSDGVIDSNLKQSNGKVDCLLLYRDGSISKNSKLQLPLKQKNIFNIMQTLQKPELFTNNINKLLNRGYKLVDGDYTKLIFVRDTPAILWKLFKNIMAFVGGGFLTLLGLSYFLDIPQQELKSLNKDDTNSTPTKDYN